MNQLESATAKYQSALAETCQLATSSQFANCIRLASEYAYIVSVNYSTEFADHEIEIKNLEQLLANPERHLGKLHESIALKLIHGVTGPTIFRRQSIEYNIKKAEDQVTRAKNAFLAQRKNLNMRCAC